MGLIKANRGKVNDTGSCVNDNDSDAEQRHGEKKIQAKDRNRKRIKSGLTEKKKRKRHRGVEQRVVCQLHTDRGTKHTHPRACTHAYTHTCASASAHAKQVHVGASSNLPISDARVSVSSSEKGPGMRHNARCRFFFFTVMA